MLVERVAESLVTGPSSGQVGGVGRVAAAIGGDTDAIRELWREHRRWVAAVLMAHKPRELDVEDLLQDVAMTLVRSISTLRDASTLKPWLRTVAINAARAAGRDSRRLRLNVPLESLDAEPSPRPLSAATAAGPPQNAGADEDAARLMALASQVPEGYREPLLLKAVRGLSYRQIGELMGLPETTIETRIARGRRMLRELAQATPPARPESLDPSVPHPRSPSHE